MKTGIIGLGRLGSALARGFGLSKTAGTIYGFNRNREKGETVAADAGCLKLCDSEAGIFELCDLVFLWTNAKDAESVLKRNSDIISVKKHIIISCTTGVPLAAYTPRWAECLPNVNMAAGSGVTVLYYADTLSGGDRIEIKNILSLVGKVYEVPAGHLSLYSAVSSCGPAIYAVMLELFADALSARHGFDRDFCRRLMRETVSGTMNLQETDGIPAEDVVKRVAHPGGSSEGGVNHLSSILPGIYNETLKKMRKW